MSAAITISARRLEAMRAVVHTTEEAKLVPESVRLKKINDEKAARKALLEAEREAQRLAAEDRLAAEEAARLEVDRQEVVRKQEERQRELELANIKLWNQNERVRALHAKMAFSEILAEREAQLALRQHLQGLEKAAAKTFHGELLRRIQEEKAAADEKASMRKRSALQLKATQDDQLTELKQSILAERKRNQEEGESIRRAAIQEAHDAQAQAAAARERARLANEATKEANMTLERLKAAEREKERLQDEAIAEHARQQQALQDARKAERIAKEATKEAKRQAMVELMQRTYLAFVKEEDEKLEADLAAADQQAAAQAAEKQRVQEKQWAEIVRSRDRQLADKSERKAQKKAAEAAFAHAWAQKLQSLQEEEAAEAQAARQKHKQYVAFLQRQIDLKYARARRQQHQESEEDLLRLWGLAEKEALFQQYAAVCVDEWQQRRRDTGPLERFLLEKRKDIAPII